MNSIIAQLNRWLCNVPDLVTHYDKIRIKLRDLFGKHDVHNKMESVSVLKDQKNLRVLLYNFRKDLGVGTRNAVKLEANGWIIDIVPTTVPTGKNQSKVGHKARTLYIPPNTYTYVKNPFTLGKEFLTEKGWSIYEIEDGTTVGFYYYENTPREGKKKTARWVPCTKHTYDASQMKWRNVTFDEVVANLQKFGYIELPVDESKRHKAGMPPYFTVGIKHPALHLFGQKTAFDYTNVEHWNDDDNYERRVWLISAPTSCELLPKRLKQLSSDYDSIQKYIRQNQGALTNYTFNGKTDYLTGFILINPKRDSINLLFPSSLYLKIRELIYDNSRLNAATCDYTRVFTFNYFSVKTADLFLNLFPQYRSYYRYLDDIIEKMAKNIVTDEAPSGDIRERELVAELKPKFVGETDPGVVETALRNPAYEEIFYEIICVIE